MVDPVLVAKAAATLLTNEKARKGVGWVLVAILSPIIVLVALLCSLGSGAADHNISAAQLCFQTGPIPADIPAEYRICIEQTRANFAELDTVIADIQSNMDEGNSLDPIRVKAVFFSLYFGAEAPPVSRFAHCFAASETRTETVTEKDEDGNDVEVERIYNMFVPIEDMGTVYSHIAACSTSSLSRCMSGSAGRSGRRISSGARRRKRPAISLYSALPRTGEPTTW